MLSTAPSSYHLPKDSSSLLVNGVARSTNPELTSSSQQQAVEFVNSMLQHHSSDYLSNISSHVTKMCSLAAVASWPPNSSATPASTPQSITPSSSTTTVSGQLCVAPTNPYHPFNHPMTNRQLSPQGVPNQSPSNSTPHHNIESILGAANYAAAAAVEKTKAFSNMAKSNGEFNNSYEGSDLKYLLTWKF